MKKIADTFWRVSNSKELETLNKSLKELHTTCLHHNFHISKCVCGWKHVLNLTVSFLQFVIVSLHCIYHCIYHYIVSLVSMWVFFHCVFIVYEILFISYVCETQRFREKRNININYYYYVVPRNIYFLKILSKFWCEVFRKSGKLEEMFSRYWYRYWIMNELVHVHSHTNRLQWLHVVNLQNIIIKVLSSISDKCIERRLIRTIKSSSCVF